MAYDFKRLSDVDVIESVKDGLNVLVEDGGEIVKIAVDDMIPAPVDEIALIASSETLEEVNDDMTVLVESNGEIKRAPSNSLGKGALIEMPDVVVFSAVGENFICNKTFSEIIDLIMSNNLHLMVLTGLVSGYTTLPIQGCMTFDSNGAPTFESGNDVSYIAFMESAVINQTFYMLSDNTITFENPV